MLCEALGTRSGEQSMAEAPAPAPRWCCASSRVEEVPEDHAAVHLQRSADGVHPETGLHGALSDGVSPAHLPHAGFRHADMYNVRRPMVATPTFASAPWEGERVYPKMDLRDAIQQKGIPVYNQGKLGSCTANSLAFAYHFNENPDEPGEEEFMPSRLFIYYNEREIEHSVRADAGAQISDGIKSLLNKGVCKETEWPYLEDQFEVGTKKTPEGETVVDSNPLTALPIWAKRPTEECYASASGHKATEAHAVEQ